MFKRPLFLTSFLLLLGSLTLVGDVVLAPLFRDGAVLQRDMPLRIWGRAGPGETIDVTFGGQSKHTLAAADGTWSVTLEPLKASASGRELVARGRNTVTVRDVLVGDLWLCSGQSNMAWTVNEAANAKEELNKADYPLIRLYQVPKRPAAKPEFSVNGKWQRCSAQTAASFSAVAYYFGRELHKELNVPIGLINSSWGATHIESWLGSEALQQTAFHPQIRERWDAVVVGYPAARSAYEARLEDWRKAKAQAEKDGVPFRRRSPAAPAGPGGKMEPGALYNGMIHPFVPASLRGVIWYQGESNAVRHAEYGELFEALIADWRAAFEQPHMPFYYVQLANVVRKYDPTKEEFSHIREAQRAALRLPQTGMAVTIDIGDDRDIHPGNKQDVGRRLAGLALAGIFEKAVEYSGPVPTAVEATGRGVRIAFEHVGGGLELRQHRTSSGFELAGKDGAFFPAVATVTGESLELVSPKVAKPQRVRYAWGNTPPATLFNAAGLPASPFVIEVKD